MLRSLFSGISGLRAHQTMLDVTGNNIANVNTTGFKASQVQFADTLSQLVQSAGSPQGGVGGTNPAQIGLGVRTAGINTNFQQGAAQLTNRSTDMMISGDGFFVVRNGNQQLFTRAGAFSFDATGQLVTTDGSLVQGWAADATGAVDQNQPLTDLRLPIATLMGARASTGATFEGNLPDDAAVGTVLNRMIDTYDAAGNAVQLSLAFTRTAAGWDVAGARGAATATGAVAFNPDGTLASGGALTVGGVAVNLGALTGYAGITSVEPVTQDGRAAGTLQSFTITADGTLLGSFSNGLKQAVGQVALAAFSNPNGLEKAGNSTYRTSVNSGEPAVGPAG
ncbi:MAG TPA: flagellar hook-basal body complex protein, partial [Actinotalea sp.]|nr:flagellar hook-basal body complex protein [Actinotalea sp.]